MRHGPNPRFYGLLALVALLAGCGGGSSYTKSDFIARADAICTSTLRQTRALTPPASSSQPGGALAVYLGQLEPLVQSEADQIRALKRPPGSSRERQMLSQYLAALGGVAAAYQQLRSAAVRGDAQTIANVEATLRASPAAALAAAYGLRVCGAPGTTAA